MRRDELSERERDEIHARANNLFRYGHGRVKNQERVRESEKKEGVEKKQ